MALELSSLKVIYLQWVDMTSPPSPPGENGTDDDNALFRQYIFWNKTSILVFAESAIFHSI